MPPTGAILARPSMAPMARPTMAPTRPTMMPMRPAAAVARPSLPPAQPTLPPAQPAPYHSQQPIAATVHAPPAPMNPMAPRDSYVASEPPPPEPLPPAPPPEWAEGAADGDKWMPPWASSADRRRSGAVGSSREGALIDPSELKSELDRVRESYGEVMRERDLLKSHVRSMEKMVHEQISGKFSKRKPRPTSAPPTARSGSPGSPDRGNRTDRPRLTKADEQEMLRRLFGKTWRPDRDKPGSGVEQLKRRLEQNEKKMQQEARAKMMEGVKKRRDRKNAEKKTREEIDAACAEMYKRDVARRKRLVEQMAKKAEAQLPEHKKSTATALQRSMHFQRLLMPNEASRAPKQAFKARGSRPATSEGSRTTPRPAWNKGMPREETERKGWEPGTRLGPQARTGAVH